MRIHYTIAALDDVFMYSLHEFVVTGTNESVCDKLATYEAKTIGEHPMTRWAVIVERKIVTDADIPTS